LLDCVLKIEECLDRLILEETELDSSIREMIYTFKQEKKQDEYNYHFGQLCISHYTEYAMEFNSEIFKMAARIELLILSLDIIDDIQDEDTDHIWVRNPALSIGVIP